MSDTTISQMPKYDSYKESGEHWVGLIPTHWQMKKLKYLAHLESGEMIKPEQFTEGGYPVYGGNGLRGYTSRFTNEGYYPLIGRQGALCGNVNYASGRFYASEHAVVVYPVNDSDPFWLGELIRLADFNRLSQSTAQPGISVGVVKNEYMPVPPISEIDSIAKFVRKNETKINEAIAIKQKQIELLKERKQIIIQQAVTQGLKPDVPMKDSGVDWTEQIPKYWQMKRVKHIFEMVMETAEKNNSHELLSVYSDIGVKPRKELEERGNKASSTDGYWMVKSGDIIVNKLLAWMGAIGLSEYDGVTSPAYDILRPRIEVDGYFYHLLFRAKFFSAELKRHSRGIMDMRLRLYFDKFGVVDVPYPPIEEQRAIVNFVKKELGLIDDGISLFEQQINKLKEYKTTLINSAVTGKIKVTEQA
ncbi:restriction endonuclease subunit S [Marinomonas polaris]|uniref:restriction endonuclease subunit S n=1 Tax=Marinomonas polaris TaxID=293552 RepID=UPI003F999D51